MSSSRIRPDDPLWILTCCGCLPIIGLLKGLLVCIPITIYATLTACITSIIFLPYDVYHTYTAILQTKKYGPNLTALAVLLLPIPLGLYPFIVTLGTFVCSLLGGLFYPAICTFEDRYPILTGGVVETFTTCHDILRSYWRFSRYDYFTLINVRYRHFVPSPEDPTFDISIIQMLIGLSTAMIGCFVNGLGSFVLATIYLLPVTLNLYVYSWTAYIASISPSSGSSHASGNSTEICCMYLLFPIFLLWNIILAPLAVICYVIAILCGICVGIGSAAISYESGLHAAFVWMMKQLVEFELICVDGMKWNYHGRTFAYGGERKIYVLNGLRRYVVARE